MSKSKKALLIVSVCCIVVGLILACAALQMIRFDLTKLNTMTFETSTYEVTEPFQNIIINSPECSIRLLPATDGQCRIVCKESDQICSEIRVENDTLTITRKDARRWYERIGIWWGTDLSVVVYLPEREYNTLFLKTVSGDVEVPDDFVFADVTLSSTSGDIAFLGSAGETLSVNSTSGDVHIQSAVKGGVQVVTTSGDIQLSRLSATALVVQTTSGDIKLDSALVDGAVKLKSTSGDVDVQRSNAASLHLRTTSGDMGLGFVLVDGTVELKSVSGDIDITRSDAASLRIQTTSGHVEGTLLSEKNFVMDTTSGSVHVPPSDSTAGTCAITTTSGDIDIDIAS